MTPHPPPPTLFPYTTLFRSIPPVMVDDEFDLDPAPAKAPLPSNGQDHAGQRAVREAEERTDRKSTRLNSSHPSISYAVFCLKKKTKAPRVRSALCGSARTSR